MLLCCHGDRERDALRKEVEGMRTTLAGAKGKDKLAVEELDKLTKEVCPLNSQRLYIPGYSLTCAVCLYELAVSLTTV